MRLTHFSTLVQRWSPRRVFATDAAGALLTATTLGIVLPRFTATLGVGTGQLRFLAGTALLLFCYSLGVYLLKPVVWWRFLQLLALLNTMYVLLTWVLLALVADAPTWMAFVYFGAEALLIAAIAAVEWRYAGTLRHRPYSQ